MTKYFFNWLFVLALNSFVIYYGSTSGKSDTSSQVTVSRHVKHHKFKPNAIVKKKKLKNSGVKRNEEFGSDYRGNDEESKHEVRIVIMNLQKGKEHMIGVGSDYSTSMSVNDVRRKIEKAIDEEEKMLDKFTEHSTLDHTTELGKDLIRESRVQREIIKVLEKQAGTDYADDDFAVGVKVEGKCDSRYRSHSGSCNNLQNPTLGTTGTHYRRLLDSNYKKDGDSQHTPTGGKKVNERSLPNPRKISLLLFHEKPPNVRPKDEPAKHPTSVSALFSHLSHNVAHDLTSSQIGALRCCDPKFHDSEQCFHYNHPSDPFFAHNCTNFNRAQVISLFQEKAGKSVSDVLNSASSFIDASPVYDIDKNSILRTRVDGLLRMKKEHPHLPIPLTVKRPIRLAGDPRTPQTPLTLGSSAIFSAEHNRIAGELKSRLMPLLKDKTLFEQDEIIFQESRRIVIAEYQNIIYNDVLKLLLGDERWEAAQFSTQTDSVYDSSVDPTVSIEFNIMYRSQHSIINAVYKHIRTNYPLRDNVFNNTLVFENQGKGWEDVLIGGLSTPCQKLDDTYVDDITDWLQFAANAIDLAATDIQRGRDFGTPTYNTLRKLCGFTALTTWDSKPSEISESLWNKLKSLYNTPEEIDLYVGILTETPLENSFVSPTSACISVKQFKALKLGDRFFFTHTNQGEGMGLGQVAKDMIRKRTFGDIFCDNLDLDRIPQDVFRMPGNGNAEVDCASRPKFEFDKLAREILQEHGIEDNSANVDQTHPNGSNKNNTDNGNVNQTPTNGNRNNIVDPDFENTTVCLPFEICPTNNKTKPSVDTNNGESSTVESEDGGEMLPNYVFHNNLEAFPENKPKPINGPSHIIPHLPELDNFDPFKITDEGLKDFKVLLHHRDQNQKTSLGMEQN